MKRTENLDKLAPIPVGWKSEIVPESQLKVMEAIGSLLRVQCHHLLNSDVLQILNRTKFDVVLHEVFDMCGLGIVEALKVKRHVVVSSTRSMDTVPNAIGNLNPITDAVLLSNFGSRLLMSESLKNIEYLKVFLRFTSMQEEYYQTLLKTKYKVFNTLENSIRKTGMIFINTHPLVDTWKVTAQNVHEIGGVAVHTPQPVNEEYSDLFDKWKSIVLISFGTVISCHEMPEEWKNGILSATKQFPDTLFIWKYDKKDSFTKTAPSNIVFKTFTPQNDILNSGRLNLFLTHGGQNSVLEAAKAGIPMIVIPLFGDQYRNAKSVEERGLGVAIDRSRLADSEFLGKLIKNDLTNESLRDRCRAVWMAMHSPAIRPEEIFIRYFEYAAKSFETFENYPKPIDIVYYYNLFTSKLVKIVLSGVMIFVTSQVVSSVLRKCSTFSNK